MIFKMDYDHWTWPEHMKLYLDYYHAVLKSYFNTWKNTNAKIYTVALND